MAHIIICSILIDENFFDYGLIWFAHLNTVRTDEMDNVKFSFETKLRPMTGNGR